MNENEYKKWREDARKALLTTGRYNESDADTVVSWFDQIKGSTERELIGDVAVNCMVEFVSACGRFNLYDSLMARLFIYAPLILSENQN